MESKIISDKSKVWRKNKEGEYLTFNRYSEVISELEDEDKKKNVSVSCRPKPKEKKSFCPDNHRLVWYITPGGGCDKCGGSYPSGTQVMDCRQCDYWLCMPCFEKEHPEQKDESEVL